MLSRDQRIAAMAHAVSAVDTHTAIAEVSERREANLLRDLELRRYVASVVAMGIAARHEAAHAWQGFHTGWDVRRVALRDDATGVCTVEGYGTDYAAAVARITFQLVGLASDLREPLATEVPLCFDIIASRLKIDALNERAIGPHLGYEAAAANAVDFVDEHAQAIENISVALLDAREMDHLGVRVFGSCGYDG